MKDKKNKRLILSIETTIAGGSISILENEIEIDGWMGERVVSKAEDILEQSAKMLSSNKIEKEQIKLICVSKDTGSLTGEKIGQAIAKGLCRALNCQSAEVSIFGALLLDIDGNFKGGVIAAVATGKNHIRWQLVKRTQTGFYKEMSELVNSRKEEFYAKLKLIDYEKLISFQNIGEDVSFSSNTDPKKTILIKQSPARLLGITALRKTASDNVT